MSGHGHDVGPHEAPVPEAGAHGTYPTLTSIDHAFHTAFDFAAAEIDLAFAAHHATPRDPHADAIAALEVLALQLGSPPYQRPDPIPETTRRTRPAPADAARGPRPIK